MVSIQYAVQGQEKSSQTQDKIFLTAYSGPENTLHALSCIQLFNAHKDPRR